MKRNSLRRGSWSVQDLERLRHLLPRRGVEATATLLRRSAACVQHKAQELLRVPPRRGDWTASDDEALRDSWGALDVRLLAVLCGRTVVELRRRAAELRRCLVGGPWTHAEKQRLKDLFGTRTDADLEVCFSRSSADIVAMARSLCLAKDKRFRARALQRAIPPAAAAPAAGSADAARMPRWTAAEVERLRALYADRDNLMVAHELGRTVTSVANKANQLGLKKSRLCLADIGRSNVGIRHGSVAAAGGNGP